MAHKAVSQRKGSVDPKKILFLSLIGAGVYLLISRTKAHAEEVTEEFIPAEKPQDQLTEQLFQASPSTIVERATEEANIKIQQVQQETTKIIGDIRTKADEDLAALKRQLETAYELKQEDLIQEYRARDEIIRVEAEQKVQAATEEAARLVEAARVEADQKVQAAREEAYLKEQSILKQIEAERIRTEALIEAEKRLQEQRRASKQAYCLSLGPPELSFWLTQTSGNYGREWRGEYLDWLDAVRAYQSCMIGF